MKKLLATSLMVFLLASTLSQQPGFADEPKPAESKPVQKAKKEFAIVIHGGTLGSKVDDERRKRKEAVLKKALELGGPADVLEPALQALVRRPRPKSEPVSKP